MQGKGILPLPLLQRCRSQPAPRLSLAGDFSPGVYLLVKSKELRRGSVMLCRNGKRWQGLIPAQLGVPCFTENLEAVGVCGAHSSNTATGGAATFLVTHKGSLNRGEWASPQLQAPEVTVHLPPLAKAQGAGHPGAGPCFRRNRKADEITVSAPCERVDLEALKRPRLGGKEPSDDDYRL
jgi:hypothetical protein